MPTLPPMKPKVLDNTTRPAPHTIIRWHKPLPNAPQRHADPLVFNPNDFRPSASGTFRSATSV